MPSKRNSKKKPRPNPGFGWLGLAEILTERPVIRYPDGKAVADPEAYIRQELENFHSVAEVMKLHPIGDRWLYLVRANPDSKAPGAYVIGNWAGGLDPVQLEFRNDDLAVCLKQWDTLTAAKVSDVIDI